jgi:hypothetical protein
MPENDIFQERINYILHSTNWIFQRFNYFLIGIAFLVTALAAIWASWNYGMDPVNGQAAWFLRIICFSGYFLSIFFTYIDYNGSVELKNLWNTLYHKPAMRLNGWVIKPYKDKLNLWDDLIGIIRPKKGRRQPASHTYLIPIFFAVFWLVISLILLPDASIQDHWVWWSVTGVVLVIVPGSFCLIHYLRLL